MPLESQGVQAWDRFAYVNNNPVRYNDPSGHWLDSALDIFTIGYGIYDISQNGLNWENGLGLAADIVGLALPAVTGLGAVVRAAAKVDDAADLIRTVNTTNNLLQAGNQTRNVAQVANQTQNIEDILKASSNVADDIVKRSGESVDTIRGREAHLNYRTALGTSYRYERTLPSGLRPDAIDWQNNIVRELKPDNPNALRRDWNQVRKYLNELVEITEETWTAYVDTYKK